MILNDWRSPATLFATAALTTMSLSACSAPTAAGSVDPANVAATLAARVDVATLGRALELADVGPLALPTPPLGDAGLDPTAVDYWRACAWAFAAEPVAARRARSLAALSVRGAGLPQPLMIGVEQNGFADSQRQTELALTFDLLGVLGLGRAAAARVLAEAGAREALGALEVALWSSGFRVERARLALAAVIAREQAVDALIAAAEPVMRRAELLCARGWLGELQVAPARAVMVTLRTRVADLRHERERARAMLAEAAGLPIDAPALAAVTPAALAANEPLAITPDLPGRAELTERHPQLRQLRLRYAVAEAQVRQAAALAWPEIAIGPRATFQADGILPGGMLNISAAFPGTVSFEVARAALLRERAREELEAALLERSADLAAKAARWREATTTHRDRAPLLDDATAVWLGAAEARFRVDPRGLGDWIMALERRGEAVEQLVEQALQAHIAALELQEARGPDAMPPLATITQEARP